MPKIHDESDTRSLIDELREDLITEVPLEFPFTGYEE